MKKELARKGYVGLCWVGDKREKGTWHHHHHHHHTFLFFGTGRLFLS